MTAVEVIHGAIMVAVLSWTWAVVVLLVLLGWRIARWVRRRAGRRPGPPGRGGDRG